MARKKYRPGMNCEKTGKYACYDANGNEMYRDIAVSYTHLIVMFPHAFKHIFITDCRLFITNALFIKRMI